jgi:hypothetical protein
VFQGSRPALAAKVAEGAPGSPKPCGRPRGSRGSAWQRRTDQFGSAPGGQGVLGAPHHLPALRRAAGDRAPAQAGLLLRARQNVILPGSWHRQDHLATPGVSACASRPDRQRVRYSRGATPARGLDHELDRPQNMRGAGSGQSPRCRLLPRRSALRAVAPRPAGTPSTRGRLQPSPCAHFQSALTYGTAAVAEPLRLRPRRQSHQGARHALTEPFDDVPVGAAAPVRDRVFLCSAYYRVRPQPK